MEAIGINVPGLITQLVSFLILFFILSKLLYGPISKALDERSNRIKERVEQEIAEARVQGQALIAEAREAAGRLRTTEEERVRADLESLRERATEAVRRERDGAIEEIRAEFANLAVDAAERVIGRSLDAQAHREIIEGVLQEGLARDGGDS